MFTVLFALAATHLAPEPRELLSRIGQALADATMILVRWIMQLTPLGVFALSFVMAAGTGLGAAGFMGAWVAISCAVMIVFTLLL